MTLLLLSLGSDECKQTVVIVGQLIVISIKMPEKNPSKHEIFYGENVNKRKIWEIWSEEKNDEHFDQIGVSGEKERQIFAQIRAIWSGKKNATIV